MTSSEMQSKLLKLLKEVAGFPESANFNSHEKEISKAVGYSRGTLYKWFPTKANSQKDIPSSVLSKMYKSLKKYSTEKDQLEFKLTKEEFINELSWKSTIYNTERIYTKKLPQVDRNRSNAKDIFARDYLPIMMELVHGSHKSLMISEFLGKGDNELGESQSIYGDVHDLIFEEIEKKIGIIGQVNFRRDASNFEKFRSLFEINGNDKKLLKYERIFFLSQTDSQVVYNSNILANQASNAIINGAFICMSRATFTHLCICLAASKSNISFYAHPLIRPYHYGIAVGKDDTEKVVFSEYYSYDKRRKNNKNRFIAEADLIIVENVSNASNKNTLLETYEDDFIRVNQNPHLISKELVEHFVENAYRVKELYLDNMRFEDSDKFTNLFNVKIEIFNQVFKEDYPPVAAMKKL